MSNFFKWEATMCHTHTHTQIHSQMWQATQRLRQRQQRQQLQPQPQPQPRWQRWLADTRTSASAPQNWQKIQFHWASDCSVVRMSACVLFVCVSVCVCVCVCTHTIFNWQRKVHKLQFQLSAGIRTRVHTQCLLKDTTKGNPESVPHIGRAPSMNLIRF